MLTDEEFRVWVQRNKIDSTTRAALARIRSSPPSHRVRGRASNVSGRYPSVKMGCSIQFESQHVELWAIYAKERDDDVLDVERQYEIKARCIMQRIGSPHAMRSELTAN
jgi:putative transposase